MYTEHIKTLECQESISGENVIIFKILIENSNQNVLKMYAPYLLFYLAGCCCQNNCKNRGHPDHEGIKEWVPLCSVVTIITKEK